MDSNRAAELSFVAPSSTCDHAIGTGKSQLDITDHIKNGRSFRMPFRSRIASRDGTRLSVANQLREESPAQDFYRKPNTV
jgi:hypothetical protein